MGEFICTVIGLLFLFGSVSIFMSLITDKHYEQPVKHSAIDNDLDDMIVANELWEDNDDEQL